MRKFLVLLTGLMILATANYAVYSREHLIESGRRVLLELAPVDPRSLIQGDYMALNFKVARQALQEKEGRRFDGYLVLRLDEKGVGAYLRFDDGSPISKNEVRIRYRIRSGVPGLASNSFFFQEGEARRYTGAKYAELRVAENGESIITGLRDENLNSL